MSETMTARRQRLHDEREVPWGYEMVASPADGWRIVADKSCRAKAGSHRRACGRPAVAELNRSAWRGRENWWAYCGDHLYDKWVEDGVVMHWILREVEPTP